MQNIKGINITWLSTTDLTNLNSGEGGSNYVDVKKYKFQDKEYPYVSGQAMRYYLKEGIRRLRTANDCCVPDDKGEACGNITTCPLCDLFGFMATIKGEGAKVRVSPVKVSPSVGLLPFDANSTIDFLTRKKHKAVGEKASGDIVNVELGMNLYKGGISIDVAKIGFEEKYDDANKKMGFTDMRSGSNDTEKEKEKWNRVVQVLESLSFLSDYSKQARLLTDFTPDFIIITFQSNYSHRLQKALELKSDEGINLNTDRLKEILADISGYSNSTHVGMITGILDNEADVKKVLTEKSITIKTPNEAIKEAIRSIRGN